MLIDCFAILEYPNFYGLFNQYIFQCTSEDEMMVLFKINSQLFCKYIGNHNITFVAVSLVKSRDQEIPKTHFLKRKHWTVFVY